MHIDYTREFPGTPTRKSYVAAENHRDAHQRIAKEILRAIQTGVAGDADGRKTPGILAYMSWHVTRPQVTIDGLKFEVEASHFQGVIEVKAAKDSGYYNIDFYEVHPFTQEVKRIFSLPEIPTANLCDMLDSAIERHGMRNKSLWGDLALPGRSPRIDAASNFAIEWDDTMVEDREAVLYRKFVESSSANLDHIGKINSMARKSWNALSEADRGLLVSINIDDALAEYKSISPPSSAWFNTDDRLQLPSCEAYARASTVNGASPALDSVWLVQDWEREILAAVADPKILARFRTHPDTIMERVHSEQNAIERRYIDLLRYGGPLDWMSKSEAHYEAKRDLRDLFVLGVVEQAFGLMAMQAKCEEFPRYHTSLNEMAPDIAELLSKIKDIHRLAPAIESDEDDSIRHN